jgi:hypothetical protein
MSFKSRFERRKKQGISPLFSTNGELKKPSTTRIENVTQRCNHTNSSMEEGTEKIEHPNPPAG